MAEEVKKRILNLIPDLQPQSIMINSYYLAISESTHVWIANQSKSVDFQMTPYLSSVEHRAMETGVLDEAGSYLVDFETERGAFEVSFLGSLVYSKVRVKKWPDLNELAYRCAQLYDEYVGNERELPLPR